MVEESLLQSPTTPSFRCQPSQFFEQVSKQGTYKAVRIRADFVTVSSRVESFQDWPHLTLPPLYLAFAGFYHDPTEEDPAAVACFACDAVWPRAKPTGQFSIGEVQTILLNYHVANCL
jgi:Inhibitor of Apoptosis domain